MDLNTVSLDVLQQPCTGVTSLKKGWASYRWLATLLASGPRQYTVISCPSLSSSCEINSVFFEALDPAATIIHPPLDKFWRQRDVRTLRLRQVREMWGYLSTGCEIIPVIFVDSSLNRLCLFLVPEFLEVTCPHKGHMCKSMVYFTTLQFSSTRCGQKCSQIKYKHKEIWSSLMSSISCVVFITNQLEIKHGSHRLSDQISAFAWNICLQLVSYCDLLLYGILLHQSAWELFHRYQSFVYSVIVWHSCAVWYWHVSSMVPTFVYV